MGLDVSHDAFSGAYSAFNRFRKSVCEATGGHWCDDVSGADQWCFWDGYDSASNPGLYEFLAQPDCDGEISPDKASALADEMEALLSTLDAVGLGGGHLEARGGIGKVARQFISGFRAAAAVNEPLEFF